MMMKAEGKRKRKEEKAAAEVAKHPTLWEDLLRRAEEHLLLNRRPGKKTQRGSLDNASTRRGPRSSFPPPPWACKPAATRCLEPLPAPPEADWDQPFAGLHFAALTAQGPFGTRAEHITDLLNVLRRVHAKIHAALSALFCRISAGSLPPAARWHAHAALLAAQEEWQTATHQDVRASAFSPCQAAREPDRSRRVVSKQTSRTHTILVALVDVEMVDPSHTRYRCKENTFCAVTSSPSGCSSSPNVLVLWLRSLSANSCRTLVPREPRGWTAGGQDSSGIGGSAGAAGRRPIGKKRGGSTRSLMETRCA